MSMDQSAVPELEREVEAQRAKVEDRIDELQRRLTPGQIVDELFGMFKGGNGNAGATSTGAMSGNGNAGFVSGDFLANLGRSVSSNPLPAVLIGVGLVWLLSSQGQGQGQYRPAMGYGGTNIKRYPLATIRGSALQRVGHWADQAGRWQSEFIDDAGRKFRAMSDSLGNRAGHFIDETGATFRGFVDDAGKQIDAFKDEAGSLLSQASGWASHAWQDVKEQLAHGMDSVAQSAAHGMESLSHSAQEGMDHLKHQAQQGMEQFRHSASQMSGTVAGQMDQVSKMLAAAFRDQPLVAGGLAFAAGAALGSILPRTAEEDKMFGKVADEVKREAATMAGELYDKGKESAAELYETAVEKTAELYDDAKATLTSSPKDRGRNELH